MFRRLSMSSGVSRYRSRWREILRSASAMGSGRGEAASSSRCRAERTSNPNDGSGRVTSVPARSLNLRAILDDLSPCPPGVVDRLVEVVEVLQSLIDSFLVQQVADRILVKRVNRFLLFVEDSECLL